MNLWDRHAVLGAWLLREAGATLDARQSIQLTQALSVLPPALSTSSAPCTSPPDTRRC